jgi:hypothetical protein
VLRCGAIWLILFGNNRRPMGLQGERLARIVAIFR